MLKRVEWYPEKEWRRAPMHSPTSWSAFDRAHEVVLLAWGLFLPGAIIVGLACG